jgi:hypothetical protein
LRKLGFQTSKDSTTGEGSNNVETVRRKSVKAENSVTEPHNLYTAPALGKTYYAILALASTLMQRTLREQILMSLDQFCLLFFVEM